MQRRRKSLITADSNHGRRIYPNLARALVLTGINQLWIAELTYIRLLEEFVFLAAILDAFSRQVIGWALDRPLDDELTLTALRMAIKQHTPPPRLVHHSDRGSQYASGDYIALLESNHIRISMSRKGNPWDNAACESFKKTLKYEEVHRNEYRDLADPAPRSVSSWKRSTTRSACTRPWATCRPPSSRHSWRRRTWRPLRASFLYEFSEAWEIYRSDVRSGKRRSSSCARPGAHRPRSVSIGYSWAGCSRARSTSASPTGDSVQ